MDRFYARVQEWFIKLGRLRERVTCPHLWYHLLCYSYGPCSLGRMLWRSRCWRPGLDCLRGGRSVAQCAVRPHSIVMPSPPFHQDLRL